MAEIAFTAKQKEIFFTLYHEGYLAGWRHLEILKKITKLGREILPLDLINNLENYLIEAEQEGGYQLAYQKYIEKYFDSSFEKTIIKKIFTLLAFDEDVRLLKNVYFLQNEFEVFGRMISVEDVAAILLKFQQDSIMIYDLDLIEVENYIFLKNRILR